MARPVALVSLDGTDTAEYVLPWARAFAAGLDLRLVLLDIVPEARGGGERGTAALEAADHYLRAVAATLRRDGFEVETRPVPAGGAVAEWINVAAEELQASLTMLATHGRSGVRRVMMGSVADAVVRAATGAVLVVRAGSDGPPQEAATIRRILLPLDGTPLSEAAIPTAVRYAGGFGATLDLVHVASSGSPGEPAGGEPGGATDVGADADR